MAKRHGRKLRCIAKARMSFATRCKVLFMVLALAAAVATAVHAHRFTRTVDGVIQTRAGALHYEVYLPADYATSGLRYPVLYFLHGLPAGPGGVAGPTPNPALHLTAAAPRPPAVP